MYLMSVHDTASSALSTLMNQATGSGSAWTVAPVNPLTHYDYTFYVQESTWALYDVVGGANYFYSSQFTLVVGCT